jgi:hypothetical protein
MVRSFLDIKVKTIAMKPFAAEGRQSFHCDGLIEKLLSAEAVLRKQAYKNIQIKTDESFFNDSDMNGDYSLIIVYNKHSFTPLLTARYYSGPDIISRVMQGDDQKREKFNYECEAGTFLIDRMCANTASSIYRRKRSYINLLFYSELLVKNSKGSFLAMARKEKGDKLLKKYLRLGLHTVGQVKHKGREHWILSGSLKESCLTVKMPFASRMFLLMRMWIKN